VKFSLTTENGRAAHNVPDELNNTPIVVRTSYKAERENVLMLSDHFKNAKKARFSMFLSSRTGLTKHPA
jgi:hypothetical protein